MFLGSQLLLVKCIFLIVLMFGFLVWVKGLGDFLIDQCLLLIPCHLLMFSTRRLQRGCIILITWSIDHMFDWLRDATANHIADNCPCDLSMFSRMLFSHVLTLLIKLENLRSWQFGVGSNLEPKRKCIYGLKFCFNLKSKTDRSWHLILMKFECQFVYQKMPNNANLSCTHCSCHCLCIFFREKHNVNIPQDIGSL